MFDIGFAELLVIGLVALVVIGPNRLPETIRTLALWLGRARRTYSQFRRDLEQEIGADEIRRELHNEEIMAQLRETQQQLQQSVETDSSRTPGSGTTGANSTSGAPQQTPLKQHSDTDKNNEQ